MLLEDIINDDKVINLETLTNDTQLVKQIQTRLNEIGLLPFVDESSAIDGIFGPITNAALTRFCNIVFLNNMSTGVFGPNFAKKLIEFRGPVVEPVPSPSPNPSPSDKLTVALKFTLKWEGGFVNHPADPGGATNKGITQVVYNGYRISKRLATQNVRNITDAEVNEIYRQQYWKPSQAELMVLPLAVVQFDTSVLFGVGGATKFLQEALGVTADGVFGTETRTALENKNTKITAESAIEKRIAFHNRRVASNPSQRVFLQGWLNRANDLKRFINQDI